MKFITITGTEGNDKDFAQFIFTEIAVGNPLWESKLVDKDHELAHKKVIDAIPLLPERELFNITADMVVELEGNDIILVEFTTNPLNCENTIKYAKSLGDVSQWAELEKCHIDDKIYDSVKSEGPDIRFHIVCDKDVHELTRDFADESSSEEDSVYILSEVDREAGYQTIKDMVNEGKPLTHGDLIDLMYLPMCGEDNVDRVFLIKWITLVQRVFTQKNNINPEIYEDYIAHAFLLYDYMLSRIE